MMYGDEHPINNRGIFRKLVKRSVNGDKVRYCISILTIALASIVYSGLYNDIFEFL